jgi:hypothetical protein
MPLGKKKKKKLEEEAEADGGQAAISSISSIIHY